MRLRTNKLDRLNILTNGRVGIGTPAPASLFHTFVGDAISHKSCTSVHWKLTELQNI